MSHKLNGKWDVVITSRMGQQKAVWDLQVSDGSITGNISEAPGKVVGVIESTEAITDNNFGFKTTLNSKFGKLGFTMTGMFTSDTEISGEATMKMMGSSRFVGKKIQE